MEQKIVRDLALWLQAVWDVHGMPNWPSGGPESGPKLIKNGFFCVFFTFAVTGKLYNAQTWLTILSVTWPLNWGHCG